MSTAAPIQSGGPPLAKRSTAVVPQPTRTRWWIEALVIVWLCWVYDAITNLAPLRLHAALAHAKAILSAEQTLHLDPEHSLDSWLAAHHTLAVALSYYYDNAHFIVTFGLLGYLWWRRADIYRPLRNSLVLANVLAFVVFWRFPVAPPRMLPGFTDVVAASHTVGSWHTGALASQANQLAAMPSLHLAWAAWCTLAIWRITTHRWLRALGVVYPFVTAFAVLATGNHFVFDIFGGLATIAVSVLIVRLFEVRLRLFQIPGFRARPARASADATVYGMSQTCYEVQDQLD
ncbi:MAG TPA: phosphatase PAP2 family protein [Solirubrobacteraceae bacterium]